MSAVDQYTQLNQFTTIVCDSGDLDSIKKFVPQDATTNPSLLYQACADPKYDVYVQDVRNKKKTNKGGRVCLCCVLVVLLFVCLIC